MSNPNPIVLPVLSMVPLAKGREHRRRDRRNEWSYQKRRKKPSHGPGSGVGRLKSPIPLAERKRLARAKYEAARKASGRRYVRLLLDGAVADRLEAMAAQRHVGVSEVVTEWTMSQTLIGLAENGGDAPEAMPTI